MDRLWKNLLLILIPLAMILISERWVRGNIGARDTLHIAVVEDAPHNVINAHNLNYLSDCRKDFGKTHPDISIFMEIIPKDSYSDWLFSRLLEGRMPDIFSILPEDFYLLASMDVLENIDGPRFADNISGNITDAWRYGGGLYAVPYYTSPPCLIVNKDLFPEGSIEFEIQKFNWMSLIYYCKYHSADLNSDGILDFFGLSNMDWRKAVYFNGATLFDSAKKTSFFTSPNVKYAIKYAVAINKTNIDNYNLSFEDNRSMIKVTNLTEAFYYISTYSERDLRIYPVPNDPDGPLLAEPYDTPMSVHAKSGNKKDAIEFLEFITLNHENQLALFTNGISFPVLTSAANSDGLISRVSRSADPETLNAVLNGVDPVKIDFDDYYALMDIADNNIFQYIKNELNIDKELVSLNRKLTSIME